MFQPFSPFGGRDDGDDDDKYKLTVCPHITLRLKKHWAFRMNFTL
jgi:hypothetical protein